MTQLSPAEALNGVQTGHICDRCNRGIRTGDKAVAYTTYYDADGWVLRGVWCGDCGSRTIGLKTDGADEAVIEAVYWQGRLVGATAVDQSRP